MENIYIMGIESSCDETSVAIVKNGREVLSNVINSQIKIHEKYGGVVPEIASRCHVEVINQLMKQALEEANITLDDIDGIAVTYGPGLVGALLVGVSYAKGLSFATGKPLIPVNHIAGHICANYITHKDLKPPFLSLIISGGHTHLVKVIDYTKFEILGKTRDDAIGEAFDKVARVVGLGYPGGPKVDKLAKEGEPNIELPISHFDNLDFSFSGIKTAVINLNHKTPDLNKANLCASFEKAATQMLLNNVKKVVGENDSTCTNKIDLDFVGADETEYLKNNVGADVSVRPINKIVLAGGVSANSYIRKEFDKFSQEKNIQVLYPELKYCTDNAAMIASAGYYNFMEGKIGNLNLNAVPNLKLGE